MRLGNNKKSLSLPRRLLDMFFAERLDFRVRLFRVLALGGTGISLSTGVMAVLNHAGVFNITMNFFALLSFSILMFSQRTGKYQLCYFLAIAGIFIGIFPVLFLTSGGYHSGMPSFLCSLLSLRFLCSKERKRFFFLFLRRCYTFPFVLPPISVRSGLLHSRRNRIFWWTRSSVSKRFFAGPGSCLM